MSGQRTPAYLETYEPVDDRIASFRKLYPGIKGRIETIDLKTEKAIVWRAEISVRDDDGVYHLIATGHAFDPWGQSSQYERTEKAAIGRALVMAGFTAKAGSSAEEMELHAAREDRRGNAAQDAPVAPQRTKAPQRQNPTPMRPEAATSQDDEPNEYDHLLLVPKVGRPSYQAVIKMGHQQAREGHDFDAIAAFFKGKKRGMSEEEFADAQKRLGEIKAFCIERDDRAAAEAELAEVEDGTGLPSQIGDDQNADF